MICRTCGEFVPDEDINCPDCGAIAVREPEDLQKTDPAMTRGIAWALIGMSVAGFVFVIANSWTDWYSGLDYIGPVGLLLLGGFVLYKNPKKP